MGSFLLAKKNYHEILCQHRNPCSLYRSVCFIVATQVQSSTHSPLLGELDCLTGAREAQGSIIDLTSQSCRAPSPSFTPPACQPHTTSATCTGTHSWTHTCCLGYASIQRCLMRVPRLTSSPSPSAYFAYTRKLPGNYTPTVLVSLYPSLHTLF